MGGGSRPGHAGTVSRPCTVVNGCALIPLSRAAVKLRCSLDPAKSPRNAPTGGDVLASDPPRLLATRKQEHHIGHLVRLAGVPHMLLRALAWKDISASVGGAVETVNCYRGSVAAQCACDGYADSYSPKMPTDDLDLTCS